MITVKITVEFTESVTTQLADLEVYAPAWNYVRPRGSQIKVFGTEHFGFDKRVDDMTVGRFHPWRLELEELAHQPPRSGSTVVVVLESPHKDEYRLRQPLVKSREHLMRNVALLCGFYLSRQVDVVVCNPIQWQASLANYYRFNREEKSQDLLGTVRKNVWEHLWNHQENGRYPARDYFMTRVRSYRPRLVINACTAELSRHVKDELARRLRRVPVVDALHPAVWRMLP